MIAFFRRLIQSKFWRQVATLSSGSILAQLLSVVTLPILSRLYLPEAYGLFGIFLAVIALMVVIVNGGYELAVMLPKSDQESDHLVWVSLRLVTIISLALLVLLWLLGETVLDFMGVSELQGWHLVLAGSLWLEGLAQPLGYALNRHERYSVLAMSRLLRAVLTVGVSLWLGWQGGHFSGLILGYVAGQMGYLLWMGGDYWKIGRRRTADGGRQDAGEGKNGGRRTVDGRRLVLEGKGKGRGRFKTAREYGDFPRYAMLSAWLNMASKQLPFFFLPRMYGTQVNGWFTKADKILNIPPAFIGMAIGRVFFQQASHSWKHEPEKLPEITRLTFLRLLVLGLPFLVIVMIWGPELFAFVLGDVWYEAGVYARWLVPWLFLAFVVSPLSFLIDIKRKLKIFMYYNLLLFVVRFAALWLGSMYFDAEGCMIVYGISGVVMLIVQLMYLLGLGNVIRLV